MFPHWPDDNPEFDDRDLCRYIQSMPSSLRGFRLENRGFLNCAECLLLTASSDKAATRRTSFPGNVRTARCYLMRLELLSNALCVWQKGVELCTCSLPDMLSVKSRGWCSLGFFIRQDFRSTSGGCLMTHGPLVHGVGSHGTTSPSFRLFAGVLTFRFHARRILLRYRRMHRCSLILKWTWQRNIIFRLLSQQHPIPQIAFESTTRMGSSSILDVLLRTIAMCRDVLVEWYM